MRKPHQRKPDEGKLDLVETAKETAKETTKQTGQWNPVCGHRSGETHLWTPEYLETEAGETGLDETSPCCNRTKGNGTLSYRAFHFALTAFRFRLEAAFTNLTLVGEPEKMMFQFIWSNCFLRSDLILMWGLNIGQ